MSKKSWDLTTTLVIFITFVISSTTFAAGLLPGGTLNPASIQKYVDPLPIPGVMSKKGELQDNGQTVDYYEIAVRQFLQQVLSSVDSNGNSLPMTPVFGYGDPAHPATFHYPAFTIEARVGRPVRVKWMNQLVDAVGNFLPHLLPIDQTLHWANPPQTCAEGQMRTDCSGNDPTSYTGPVPIVVHLHGAHANPESDGYPEAWYLPNANNIPQGFATRGSNFGQTPGAPDEGGAAVFQYRNDQPPATLWYHDHALGMTRTNVYAGLAGFFLLRGGPDDLPSGGPGQIPGGSYEIPIAIQDRSFNSDGSLFYPPSREFFDGFAGPYIGNTTFASDVSPIWNPEFFGNTIVVNGKTWPYLNVEPRKYRLRILNGSDSRFLILDFNNPKVKIIQIGAEGGFLPVPVVRDRLLIAPGERADTIFDFTDLTPGQRIIWRNSGPDEPFGGLPVAANEKANPATTGQVMQFRVVPLTAPDRSAIPQLPPFTPIGTPTEAPLQVSLNEAESTEVCVDEKNIYIPGVTPPLCENLGLPLAPLRASLGIVDDAGASVPLRWEDPISENPPLNSTEIWEIHNLTVDAHPIHLHMVQFQLVDRIDMLSGAVSPPEPQETGFKDTVIAYPGMITRIKANYDIAGLFVWHCHILSHEDHEMMRPYCVGEAANCEP